MVTVSILTNVYGKRDTKGGIYIYFVASDINVPVHIIGKKE